jgi:putative nucleotidyltransferase with HDIG domain
MSTIETLAMAVDAKDQITHGHIRRVQVYAVELAKRLGVRHEHQLRAIEAAALLHDMGKLAIPEYILNKPGKLTTAEFDKMKQHADIGADLLSSIRFPYPVVPIVRHHHENWDGRGYPAGISGTDIPLGARILSVVDCFDALTSDRPYRPRLATDEAFDILLQRRGSMYDPLVVDTFIAVHPQIAPMAVRAGQEAKSLTVTSGAVTDSEETPALTQIRATATETAVLNESVQNIERAKTLAHALEVVWHGLRHITPIATCAIYRYDPNIDALVCECAAGDPDNLLSGLMIRLGERVTGWSAANRRISMNSDASLDLFQIVSGFAPRLRSVITIPLTDDDRLVGVFAGYSSHEQAFNDAHRYCVERVASLLTRRLVPQTRTVISFPIPKS